MRYVQLWTLIVMAIVGLTLGGNAMAGKHSPGSLAYKIPVEIIDIMRKHGMPIEHNKPATNKWFGFSHGTDRWIGGNPSYGLLFYDADQVPIQAQIEIIEYCMKLYEEQERNITITIHMMDEKFEPRLIKPAAFFELKLNRTER